MSSVIRVTGQKKEGLTRFVKPNSPSYDTIPGGGGEIRFLFPFSYSNQVLDITYEGNNFKEQMVDISGEEPEASTETIVRILSGPVIATSLGPNFKEYIRSWRSNPGGGNPPIDAGSPIEMYVAPQLLRVQQAAYTNITSTNADSYKISDTPPASDNYISGDAATQYNSTYVFKTPLTFTTVEGGVTKYITFKSVLDQE